ncbi:MAG: glucose-6-phosphate dehydrogenase [archaeon]|nr:glucose-6-phosphate dehydrogenase [archaeon]
MRNNFTFIIMGATGDLAQKKLFPALHGLIKMKKIGGEFNVVAVARKDLGNKDFMEIAKKNIKSPNEEAWKTLSERTHYFNMDFNDAEKFAALAALLDSLDAKSARHDRLFYLATLPAHFGPIAKNIKKCGLADAKNGWARVVFEKPFGDDRKSAKKLDKELLGVFGEDQIYRIDHYLGKELVQNIGVLRFANMLFTPLWNRAGIDHVQINILEDFGVGGRGEFYDATGALRDVAQNHLLQLLCLTAMEVPKDFSEKSIRDEKVKVLKSVRKIAKQDVVLGQYEGYEKEKGVKRGSKTETFCAFRVFVDNERWRGVPFYLRTGKNLGKKFASIYIQFKSPQHDILQNRDIKPNYLVVQIQPDDGMLIRINGKVPGEKMKIMPVKMTFCHECTFGPNTPEAYETLIVDAIDGSKEAFIRSDEIDASWKIIDQITKKKFPVNKYNTGSFGPNKAEELAKANGREWFNKIENVVQGL